MPLIRADPDRLTQVMLNLLSNAAKFVPAEGGRVEVVLHTDGGASWSGPRQRARGASGRAGEGVEKFRQGGEALCRPPGTGLGLPISRQIVEHFGGRMWLDAEPGGGACFAFRLPFWQMERREHREHKVLIADDEPNIVVSLEFMMKREGYEVLAAATVRRSRRSAASDRGWCCSMR